MAAANNLPEGEAAFNLLYAGYRHAADKRTLEFSLTKEEFKNLTREHCFYCGGEPRSVCKPRLPNGGYKYNGVDRKNNRVGYIPENCVPCCGMCNWMKNTYTIEEFLSQCATITEYQNRKALNGQL